MRLGAMGLRRCARWSVTAITAGFVAGLLTIAFSSSADLAAPGPGGEEIALPMACPPNYLVSARSESGAGAMGSLELAALVTTTSCGYGGCCSPETSATTTQPSTTTTTHGDANPVTTTTTSGSGVTTSTTTGGGGGGKSGTGPTSTTSSGAGGGGATATTSGGGSGGGSGGDDATTGGGGASGGSAGVSPANSDPGSDASGSDRDDGEYGAETGSNGNAVDPGDERSRGGLSRDLNHSARTVSMTIVPGMPLAVPLESMKSGLLVFTILEGLGAFHLLMRRIRMRLVALVTRRRTRRLVEDGAVAL